MNLFPDAVPSLHHLLAGIDGKINGIARAWYESVVANSSMGDAAVLQEHGIPFLIAITRRLQKQLNFYDTSAPQDTRPKQQDRDAVPHLSGLNLLSMVRQLPLLGKTMSASCQVPPPLQSILATAMDRAVASLMDELQQPRGQPTAWEESSNTAKIHEEKEYFHLLMENLTDYGVLMLDEQGHIKECNVGLERLTGFTREAVIGRSAAILFTPEDCAAGIPEHEWQTAKKSGRCDDIRWHQRSDGSQFWGSGVTTALSDSLGRLKGYVKVVRDRTDQKVAEIALRSSEERFRSIFEHASVGIAMIHPHGHYLEVNPAYCATLGYSAEELFQLDFMAITHPEDRAQNEEWLRQLRQREVPALVIEIRYLGKEGQTVWMRKSISAVFSEAGYLERFICLGEDITTRMRAQEALAKSEERIRELSDSLPSESFRRLFEALPGQFAVLDHNFNIVAVSDAFLRATASKREDIIGLPLFDIYRANAQPPQESDLEGLRLSLERVLSTQCSEVMAVQRYDIRTTSGQIEPRYWNSINAPVLSLSGAKVAFILHRIEDVTKLVQLKQEKGSNDSLQADLLVRMEQTEAEVYERAQELQTANAKLRASEARLRQSEANFRLLAEAMPQMVWTALPNGKLDYCNRRWFTYTGLSESETYDAAWLDAVHPHDKALAAEKWGKSCQSNTLFQSEHRFRGKDGRYRWFLCRAVPIQKPGGGLIRWLGTSTDIDDRKRWEEETHAAKLAAQEANQTKSAFLANMSHEIRSPLSAMLTYCEFLTEEDLSAEERNQFIKIIARNGHALAQLIDDILDLSKVEANYLNIERLETPLRPLLTDVITSLQPKAQEKKLPLEVVWDPNVPETISADPVRLRQILLNIIGNAIKFTPQGSVTISLQLIHQPRNARTKLAIKVKDTGIGISPTAQAKLFEPFVQAHTSTTRIFGGTGLGLTLARRLARALGGDVICQESAEGRGSTFVITIDPEADSSTLLQASPLQLDKGTPPKMRGGSPQSLAGITVLLAEDNLDMQASMERMLQKFGAKVESVHNGAEAVARALTTNYDVILMDLHMPILDGYDAAAQLRAHGYAKPIIALTAQVMREQVTRCLRAGCNDYLAKPPQSAEFVPMILRYTTRSIQQSS